MKKATLEAVPVEIPSIAEIEEKLSNLKPEGSELAKIAEKAEKLLGYRSLNLEVGSSCRRLQREKGVVERQIPLLTALKELDMRVYPKEMIRQYKTEKERRANWFGLKKINDKLLIILFFGSFLGIVLFGVNRHFLPMGISASVLGFLLLSFKWKWLDEQISRLLYIYEWKIESIQDYGTCVNAYMATPIPIFVLNKAIAIREKLPEASIYVEYLGKKDPLLFVRLGDASEYVEVWDENDLEKELQNS